MLDDIVLLSSQYLITIYFFFFFRYSLCCPIQPKDYSDSGIGQCLFLLPVQQINYLLLEHLQEWGTERVTEPRMPPTMLSELKGKIKEAG